MHKNSSQHSLKSECVYLLFLIVYYNIFVQLCMVAYECQTVKIENVDYYITAIQRASQPS